MPRRSGNLLLALMGTFVVALVTMLVLFTIRTSPPPPLPNPNGYAQPTSPVFVLGPQASAFVR